MTIAYTQGTGSLSEALERLRRYITDVPASLSALSDLELTYRLPEKWSRKEVLGHLIDSALTNLKRFTEASFSADTYQVVPYSQNQLVVVNQYQTLPLPHLLTLWCALNSQILYVAEALPKPILSQPIQFNAHSQLYTLEWLIQDYVAHLEHHLKTLIP